ncbi:MAG TPA: thiol-disulfide oxidoreductase DCC family protein [Ignavibacteria bacterium]|nr:thiol-disulfide oxidoreductase [Bacteroidota bacterium]HRI85491.1 thiol-disulfide oxidoreductase DCC family protein [Ignavibacteria bacterium]HRJ99702.1 thiol-disulfide oxidoreductase DCC family protein [Ignavibacteria bacterium]
MEKFKIILFDGVCNLCNSSVNFIIDKDVRNVFKFASLQSETGTKLIKNYNLTAENIDSVILIDNDRAYIKSDAALMIAAELGGVYKILSFMRIIPKFIRDFFYDIIARNRYRWFGKKDVCRIPTPELKSKFL